MKGESDDEMTGKLADIASQSPICISPHQGNVLWCMHFVLCQSLILLFLAEEFQDLGAVGAASGPPSEGQGSTNPPEPPNHTMQLIITFPLR